MADRAYHDILTNHSVSTHTPTTELEKDRQAGLLRYIKIHQDISLIYITHLSCLGDRWKASTAFLISFDIVVSLTSLLSVFKVILTPCSSILVMLWSSSFRPGMVPVRVYMCDGVYVCMCSGQGISVELFYWFEHNS